MKVYTYKDLLFTPCSQGGLFIIAAVVIASVLFFSSMLRAGTQTNSFSSRIQTVIRDLQDTPYQGGTLESDGKEHLIVRFDAFDCVTFVETVTAAAACGLSTPQNTPCFRDHLRALRYRNGEINGYASRLHYFSEWILQNGNGPWYTDITQSLGGTPLKRTFTLMSGSINRYPKLSDSSARGSVKSAEKKLSAKTFYYIPQRKIQSVESRIPDTALIAFVSSRNDSIVSHTGFAIKDNDTVRLAHASSSAGKVTISDNSLSDYTTRNDNAIGIIVLAPAL